MSLLIAAENESAAAVRTLAADQSLYAAMFCGVCLLFCAVWVKERPEFIGKAPQKPWLAARDIWANGHARLLIIAIFIGESRWRGHHDFDPNAEYVLDAPAMAPIFILSYMVFSFVLTPLWMPLARRISKSEIGGLFDDCHRLCLRLYGFS